MIKHRQPLTEVTVSGTLLLLHTHFLIFPSHQLKPGISIVPYTKVKPGGIRSDMPKVIQSVWQGWDRHLGLADSRQSLGDKAPAKVAQLGVGKTGSHPCLLTPNLSGAVCPQEKE